MTQAFNLSQLANNVNTSGQLNAAAGLYNQTPVANGGTGLATVTTGAILVGAGTAAMTSVPAATVNNVLTANGTTWVSSVSQGGPAPVKRIYTSPATWTKPALCKGVYVTVIGGGGSGAATSGNSSFAGGGAGGVSYGSVDGAGIAGPVSITVGAGGAAVVSPPAPLPGTPGKATGLPGGTSSFGTLLSATGGVGGPQAITTTAISGAGTSTFSTVSTSSPYVVGVNGLPQPSQYSLNTGIQLNTVLGYGGSLVTDVIIGIGGIGNTTPGGNASGYGAGGGLGKGPNPAPTTSGTGAGGVVFVEEFY